MLDMAEEMERNKNRIPISHSMMADYCFNLRAYAKALHHRELQFFQEQTPATIESLIEINAMLRQDDAALGTLNLARQHFHVRNPESWYEKLGQWDEALRLYTDMERTQLDDNAFQELLCSRLRCLHALGEWEQALEVAGQLWSDSDQQLRLQVAPFGAAAAWHTESWPILELYWSAMDPNSGDRAFYGAISSLQRNRLPSALSNIANARDLLDPELTSLLDESPDRLDRYIRFHKCKPIALMVLLGLRFKLR